jgi:hypothetical protein
MKKKRLLDDKLAKQSLMMKLIEEDEKPILKRILIKTIFN